MALHAQVCKEMTYMKCFDNVNRCRDPHIVLSFVWDELWAKKNRIAIAMYPMAKVALRHFPTLQPKISMYLTVAAKGQGHCGSEPYNPVASNNACSSPRVKKIGRDYGSLCR